MFLPPALPLNNNKARNTIAVAIVCPILATFAVIARFISKRLRGQYGLDDWLTTLALLMTYGHMIITIISVVYGGVGHHIQDLSKENIVVFYKLITALQFTFGLSLGLAKISLCVVLIRVFYVSKMFKVIAFVVMGYCAAWMLTTVLIGALLCEPFAFYWDQSIPGGHCGARNPAYVSVAALDIFGDTAIIALPMPIVWKLKINMANKLGLSVIFAMAFLDIIIAILRIYSFAVLDFDGDFTYSSNATYIWSMAESSLGVVIACIPIIRPLLEHIFPRLRSTRGESNRSAIFPERKRVVMRDLYLGTDEDSIPFTEATSWSSSGPTTKSAVREITRSGPLQVENGEDQIQVQKDITVQYRTIDAESVIE